MRLAFRTAWPPAVAIDRRHARAARSRGGRGRHAELRRRAAPARGGDGLLFVLICGWVRVRDDVAAWWKAQMDARPAPTRQDDR